jgi:ubiquinone biosynthesis protein COQ4
MGFKYIDTLATPDNVDKLLTLVDKVAGVGVETNNVFDLEDALRDSAQMQKCLEQVRQDPASAQLLEERYMGEEFNLEELLKLPPHSLGWTYAKALSAMNYDPQFYRLREIHSDVDYITHRVRKTHDLHHILTGFSFDDYGELGVISVTIGQIQYPAFVLIDLISGLLIYLSGKEKEGIENYMRYSFDLVFQGIQIARQAKPLFGVKWEEGLDRSLDEWRNELGVIPVTSGQWSWYSRPLLQEALSSAE